MIQEIDQTAGENGVASLFLRTKDVYYAYDVVLEKCTKLSLVRYKFAPKCAMVLGAVLNGAALNDDTNSERGNWVRPAV